MSENLIGNVNPLNIDARIEKAIDDLDLQNKYDAKGSAKNVQDALDLYKTSNNLSNQELSNRIDNLVLNSGDSPAEVTDAHLDANGKAYNTLKERLDTENSELKSDLEEQANDIKNIIVKSENIFNPASAVNGYWSKHGLQTASSYADWFASEKIDVKGSVLQSNIPLNSVIFFNADGSIDQTNTQEALFGAIETPVDIPTTAKQIAVSLQATYITSNIMMNFGDMLLPYSEYGNVYFNDEILKRNPKPSNISHSFTYEDYLTDFKQAISKNVVVTYSANFDSFTSLKIGFTSGDYVNGYTDYFEITSTNFIMHRKGYDDVSWEHGLSIEKFIGVSITFDFDKKFDVIITTIGGTYSKSNYIYLGKTYHPFAIIDGTNVTNNRLSATCKDFDKSIYLFGDSYLENDSSRWIKYFDNQDSILINQYAGESSESAIIDFRTIIKYGKPKFVVWCLGMNDGTDADENTPSNRWLPYIEEVIDTCEENNIVPILATVPNVPTINHDGKNKWIRESGYSYIDFAKAVNSDSSGNWYSGLLSTDGIHPTTNGAKVLLSKAITDFPDLLIKN